MRTWMGQQVVPATRRGKIKCWRDLAQIVQHRFLPLWNVDYEAKRNSGRHRHREIAHPGNRQIGQDGFIETKGAAAVGISDASQHIAVGQYDALWLARAARGMQEYSRTFGPRALNQGVSRTGVAA